MERTQGSTERQAIADQMTRYALFFDAHEVESWVSLFSVGAVFEVRLPGAEQPYVRLTGADELRAFATSSPRVLHHITSLAVDLTEDSAHTRAVVLGTWASPKDGNPSIFTHGTYDQRWRKVEGNWLIEHTIFASLGYHRDMEPPSR